MRSSDFRTALRYRYRLRIPAIREGARCTCVITRTQPNGRKEKSHPTLDPWGYHVCTGCGKDGKRIQTHDAVVAEINNLIRFAGGNTIREERDCFGAYLAGSNQRPDISILNPEGLNLPGTKVLLDVMVTCPLDGAASGIISTPTKSEAMGTLSRNLKDGFRAKMKKYEDLKKEISRRNPGDAIDTDEFKVYPIVFESTGQLYPESVNFLTLILEQAAINMRASSIDNLQYYFFKKVSIVLQTSISRAINCRVANIMSHQDFRFNRQFPDDVIAEEHKQYT
jgi:hypothetical protein